MRRAGAGVLARAAATIDGETHAAYTAEVERLPHRVRDVDVGGFGLEQGVIDERGDADAAPSFPRRFARPDTPH